MISWLKWLLAHIKALFDMLMRVWDYEPLLMPMDDPPITASLGSIDCLIRRLKSLEGSKHILPVGLGADQIRKLREHLETFREPLKTLSEVEDTSFRAKWWMKEVRELCYDTEDYLVQSGAGVHRAQIHLLVEEVRIPAPLGRIASIIIYWIHSKLKWRPKLSQFLSRAEVLKRRCPCLDDRSKADDISLKKEVKALDTSFDKENKADIERSRRLSKKTTQLFKVLAFDGDKHKQLKVVTISGVAGAGKTTCARTLYVKYKKKFECSAFVRISRDPDIRSLLTSIHSQIKATPPSGFPNVHGLIVSISKHLQGKRYFIVIDDVQRTSVWDIISRALPGGIFRSRIIITTDSERVASACSGYKSESTIFKMGTLNSCTNTSFEEKSGILNSRYNNLPLHLKTCLLYLTMYLEGCTIMKDDLVKRWVAEGFIDALKGKGTEEIAEVPPDKTENNSEVPQDSREDISEVSQINTEVIEKEKEDIARGYFDELVTRGMIQPVDRNHKDEVLSCTVHHMVLDLIRYKSKEDNFIVVVDNLDSSFRHPDIVRRLSVQFGYEKGTHIPVNIMLSQVRSLAFCGFFKCVPLIADYGLLQVLEFHIWADEDRIFDLTRIGELYQLRYLKMECNVIVRLPSKIRRLQHLGTLELHAEVVAIPSDIGHLKKLLHLRCPSKADVKDLGDLTRLLDLQLTCSTVENLEEHMKSLRSVLEKLSSLRCLALVPASGSCSVNTLPANPSTMCITCDSLCIVSPAPAHLQRLELSRRCCIFSRLPKWLGELAQLCILKIAVGELSGEDIDILKGMPALTTLSMHVQPMAAERIVFRKEGFSLLTYFKFACTVPRLEFEAGAMPNLEKLKLCFNSPIVNEEGTTRIIIIERLSGLKEISVIIGSAGVDAVSAWQKAIKNDSRNPTVQLMGSIYYDRGMETREGSGEEENNEADIRVHMQPESSLPEIAASISEITNMPSESERTDEHTGQIIKPRKRKHRGVQTETVIRMQANSEKVQQSKAMRIAAAIHGVESVTLAGEGRNLLRVVGEDLDSNDLISKLRRKVGHAEIIELRTLQPSHGYVTTAGGGYHSPHDRAVRHSAFYSQYSQYNKYPTTVGGVDVDPTGNRCSIM